MIPLPGRLGPLAERTVALTTQVVGTAAGLASETVGEANRIARQIPAVERARREWRKVETRILLELGQRLDEATNGTEPGGPADGADRPADDLMRLMMSSAEQSADEARAHIFGRVVRELVPDEVRILAALSDGTTYPLVNVAIRNKVGATTHLLLENASTVGRSAGVMLADQVPTYVNRLRDLGLAQVLPEDTDLDDEYDILLSESMVQLALTEAQHAGRLASHVQRRTLQISPFGQQLWSACTPASPELES